MSDLKAVLEFYRDLGVKDLYRVSPVAVAESAAAPVAVATPAPVVPAPVVPDLVVRAPAPVPEPLVVTPPPPSLEIPDMPKRTPPVVPQLFTSLPSLEPENDSFEQIRADIGDCRRCRLCEGRNKIVFGSGNPQAKLVFVGEAPGADEDIQGLPFVGRAGQLLTQMINNTAAKEGIAITRDDVYIANVAKCRPPENRAPMPDEMEVCGQFLSRQLAVLKPKAICALGGTSAKALLGTKEGVTKMRGNWYKWRDYPVMVTYHPSFLLRAYNVEAKREAWLDLKKVLHFVYD